MVDITVFGWSFEAEGHEPFDVWSDEYLADAYPDDLTNLLVLQRIGANAAATVAQGVAAVNGAAPAELATSAPHTPPAERNSPATAPLAHPAHATPATPQVEGENVPPHLPSFSGAADGMNWINIALRDYGLVLPITESASMTILQAEQVTTQGPGLRDNLRFNSNVLHHLLPGEMIRIRRTGRFQDKAILGSLRQKVSRIGTTMGAILRLVETEQYIEIGRLN